jgi:hypothetical protein
MARLACTALILFVTCAGVAVAAPPWSAPETVSSSSLFVDNPDIVVSADGRAIATWRWSGVKPAQGDAPGGTRLAVREPGALDFGPERSAPNFVTPLITYSLDRVVGLDTRRRSRGRISLRARFGNSRGTFGPPRTISTYGEAGGVPSLAAPNGNLAAWIAKGSSGRRIVRAAIKSRGRFRHPVTLRGRGRARDVVAGAALGVMFVAWERGGVVEARVKLSSRRSWGGVQRLGRAQPSATTFAVVGSGRRAYLAWLAEAAESAVLRVAVLPAASSRFRAAQTIDTIEHEAPADRHALGLVAIPDRDALLAWSDWDGAQWRVTAAMTAASSPTFSDAFGVSPAGQSSVLGDAAAAPPGTPVPGGTVMLAWSRLDAVGELGDRVQAAIRPPDGPFGPAEDVSDLDRARLPAVAFDFSGHRWTALWSQRIGPDQPGVPLNQITTFARSSTRPG